MTIRHREVNFLDYVIKTFSFKVLMEILSFAIIFSQTFYFLRLNQSLSRKKIKGKIL